MTNRDEHAVIHALYIYAINFVKVGFRSSFKIPDVRDSGVVDQDIYVAMLKYLVESGSRILLNRNVATICLRVSTGLRDLEYYGLGRRLVDIEHVDASTGLGEGCRDRPSNTARAPGYYGDLVSQTLRVASGFQMNTLLQLIVSWTAASLLRRPRFDPSSIRQREGQSREGHGF
jgi:hypothetical protein